MKTDCMKQTDKWHILKPDKDIHWFSITALALSFIPQNKNYLISLA